MSKYLVINGDDAGTDAQADQKLLSLAKLGVMRAASVQVNGPYVKNFLKQAREFGMSIGLHFNLSDGVPTGGPYKTITDKNGEFFSPKQVVWEKAANNKFDPDEIAAEAKAQWLVLQALHDFPDHVDGHNHIHIFPNVLQSLARALNSNENLYVRVPKEPECQEHYLPGLPISIPSVNFMQKHSSKSWRYAQRFAGYLFTHFPNKEGIAHLNHQITGLTELMVHPNQRPGSSFTVSKKRNDEYNYLASKEFINTITNWGYVITDFKTQL